jgi:cell wall-associated NlpC family hydrolase
LAEAVQGAVVAHKLAPSRATKLNRIVMLGSALVLALTMAAVEAPAISAHGTADAAPARGSQAALILRLVKKAVGHGFRFGAEGPRFFDCSGLVWSVYHRAGLVGRIGGARRGATGYLHWAQRHNRLAHRNPQIGDVILWGSHGRAHHSGIYIGNGRAISALNRKLGVRNWPVRWIHMRILGYVRTGITR